VTSRRPLSVERVVDAAVAVADRGGIDAVSMRTVGRELGVEAMSLYHHVASKEALLDALADWIFARVVAPEVGMGWRAGLVAHSESVRAVLGAHPWAFSLVESRRDPGPVLLAHHEAVLACLQADGFSVRLSAHAFSLVDAYVYGFALTERNLPFDPGVDGDFFVEAIMAQARTHPALASVAMAWVEDRYSFTSEFDYGLGLVLDAIAQRLVDERDG
jgi:AcrR family transcriptional regulator